MFAFLQLDVHQREENGETEGENENRSENCILSSFAVNSTALFLSPVASDIIYICCCAIEPGRRLFGWHFD